MARLRPPGSRRADMPGITPDTIAELEARAQQDARRAAALDRNARAQRRRTQDDQAEAQLLRFGVNPHSGLTHDSFQNFAANIGLGTDNISSGANYGFNPISRVRTLLEWIHRGTWIGGVAIDVVAEDMTRAGVDLQATLDPEDAQKMQSAMINRDVWGAICDSIKWARLYGGGLGVMMIEGQDPSTPLRVETVGPRQFLGIWAVDRWMVQPTLNRAGLVNEFGPDFGLPAFYDTMPDQAAIPRMKIHHSRCLRFEGVRLPYWQRVMENLWGISVIERIYDRMTAFDSATSGAAQLVYRSFIREYKVKNYRQIVAEGGTKLRGLQRQVDMMRRMQGIEGVTIIDTEDEFNTHGYQGFSGLADALMQFGQQISGALQIPLVRLFGQSPAGLNATGESDLITYYDGINSQQERHRRSFDRLLRVVAQSEAIKLPDQFNWKFAPLWQLTDKDKSEVAERKTGTILAGYEQGLVSQQVAMKELSHQSRTTGVFTNISPEDIEAADDEVAPSAEELRQEQQEQAEEMGGMPGAPGAGPPGAKPPGAPGQPKPPGANGKGKENQFAGSKPPQKAKQLMHGGKGRDASERLTKAEAGYRCPADGQDRCGGCSMFIPAEARAGACTLVEGEIEPIAVCEEFEARAPDEAPASATADAASALYDGWAAGIPLKVERRAGELGKPLRAWAARRTLTQDGRAYQVDQVEVILGPEPDSEHAYLISLHRLKGGIFERHQLLLGFDSQEAAVEGLQALYPVEQSNHFAKIVATRVGTIKHWLKGGQEG